MLLKECVHKSNVLELFLKPHIPCRPQNRVGDFSTSRRFRHYALKRPIVSGHANRGPLRKLL
jgi:hypothetical protein